MSLKLDGMNVFVLEDDPDIQALLSHVLGGAGAKVNTASEGETGLASIRSGKFDAVFLDWMLPGKSGLEVLTSLKADPTTQDLVVIMVTAKDDPNDIVAGLNAGADDYVVKPFDSDVLIARAHAVLRRRLGAKRAEATPKASADVISLGPIQINRASYDVALGGVPIQLTPYEFKLMVALIENQGRVLTRERLIALVQGDGVAVVDRAIDTHVFGLRKKLGKHGDLIETIRGVGYRVK